MIGIRSVLGFWYTESYRPDLLAPQPKVWQGYNSRRNAKRRKCYGGKRGRRK